MTEENEDQLEPALSTTKSQRRRYYTRDGRGKLLGIPPKIEAMFVLLTDRQQPVDTPLTREELDINPITKDLPKREKNVLAEYWPTWNEHLKTVDKLKGRISDSTAAVVKAHRKGTVTKREQNITSMSLGDQLEFTGEMLGEQIVAGALVLVHLDKQKVMTDEAVAAVYRSNIGVQKDLIFIAKSMMDLGARFKAAAEQRNTNTATFVEISDEGQKLLEQARSKLAEASDDGTA